MLLPEILVGRQAKQYSTITSFLLRKSGAKSLCIARQDSLLHIGSPSTISELVIKIKAGDKL